MESKTRWKSPKPFYISILIHFIVDFIEEKKLIDWLMLMSFKSFSIKYWALTINVTQKPSLYLITQKESKYFISFLKIISTFLSSYISKKSSSKSCISASTTTVKGMRDVYRTKVFQFTFYFLSFSSSSSSLHCAKTFQFFFWSECYNVNSVTPFIQQLLIWFRP